MKAQVHGVEHQLDRHENGDDVAAEDETRHAECKQNRAQDQVPAETGRAFMAA